VARVNQIGGGVATIFWLKSGNLRFFSGGVKKFPNFVEQKKFLKIEGRGVATFFWLKGEIYDFLGTCKKIS
jgi:hypothetical protein